MNRTIKFQLSNIKQSYFYAALITYGAMVIFGIIALLTDTNLVSNMSVQPIWLIVLGLVFAPFTFLAIMYALLDGLMFFDTSLRLGVSRQSYFITQLVIYAILTLMLAIGDGLTEVPWTGATGPFFSKITENYLSVGNLASEFIQALGLGVIMLAVYRFKVKALIPLVFAGPAVALIAAASYGVSGNSFVTEIIVNVAEFVMNNPELSAGIVVVILIGVYYLFITKTEVQD